MRGAIFHPRICEYPANKFDCSLSDQHVPSKAFCAPLSEGANQGWLKQSSLKFLFLGLSACHDISCWDHGHEEYLMHPFLKFCMCVAWHYPFSSSSTGYAIPGGVAEANLQPKCRGSWLGWFGVHQIVAQKDPIPLVTLPRLVRLSFPGKMVGQEPRKGWHVEILHSLTLSSDLHTPLASHCSGGEISNSIPLSYLTSVCTTPYPLSLSLPPSCRSFFKRPVHLSSCESICMVAI